MPKYPVFRFLIMTLFLAGCAVFPTLTPDSPQPEKTQTRVLLSLTPGPTVAITFPATVSPTPTFTPLLPTRASTSTPTSTLEPRMQTQCVEIAPDLPPEARLRGILVLTPPPGSTGFTYLVDLETGSQRPLPQKENEQLLDFVVSLDRKQMAYRRWIVKQPGERPVEDWLVVANADGQQLTAIPYKTEHLPYEEGEWEAYYWLDNQRFIINQRTSPVDTMLVLDPFTGKQQELPTAYPHFDPTAESGLLWWEAVAIYDSTLTRVVYAGLTDDFKPSIVLWDLQARQVLVNIPTFIFGTRERPKWSPDDVQFAFAMPETYHENPPRVQELYSISRDGQVTRLTHLTESYKEVDIGHYEWSPDGRYIAFWMNDLSKNPPVDELVVVDTVTRAVTNYCIPGDESQYTAPPPLWSPDGQQLIVVNRSTENHRRVILVDIVRGLAAQIAEDMEPVGWLVAP